METHVTEPRAVNKPWKQQTKRLADAASACLSDSFARQGFASAELVTRWADIAGPEIAVLAEPIKLQWQRTTPGESEPATLVLRVEGPAAIEVQHLSNVILERVNRFLGWRAVDRLALRQAPLRRRPKPQPKIVDPTAAAQIAATLDKVEDESLRGALGRLGAAIKRS
jgi:hypothetical protein